MAGLFSLRTIEQSEFGFDLSKQRLGFFDIRAGRILAFIELLIKRQKLGILARVKARVKK